MTMARMLGCLWRRHWWEAILFWAISSLTSWISVHATGSLSYRDFEWLGLPTRGFAWLEVTAVVWLTARVALSQQGFATFGGWQTRPLRPRVLWLSELFFLGIVFLPALAIRIRCAVDLLAPSAEGWGRLWSRNWDTLLAYHCGLYLVFKGVGFFASRLPRSGREHTAWSMILVAVLFALFTHREILQGSMGHSPYESYSANSSIRIVPAGLSPDTRGDWLIDGYGISGHTVSSDDPAVMRLPLRPGTSIQGQNLQVWLHEAKQSDTETAVHVEITMTGNLAEPLYSGAALMIRYSNGYCGSTTWIPHWETSLALPYLPVARNVCFARLHSPLALPENELSWAELVDGAELYVLVKWPTAPGPAILGPRRLAEQKDPVTQRVHELLDRPPRTKDGPIRYDELRRTLFHAYGANGVEAVLDRSPWSPDMWEAIVLPYLERFADESHRNRMLEILEINPLIGEAFVRKGWTAEAIPVLQRHLMDGKKLGPDSLLALIALGEEDMGPMLENQFHRLDGTLDAVAAALQTHPGVDWEGVKREAWRRVKYGYNRHHLRVKWGAELGDKEALRRFLVKALAGNKWERGILQEWFGGEDAAERLVKNWGRVVFVDGRWRMGE